MSMSDLDAVFYVTAANAIYVQVPMGATTGVITITTDAGSVDTKALKIS